MAETQHATTFPADGPHRPGPDDVLLAALETNATGSNPWIVVAKPGLVVEVPFALAAAALELRAGDLYVRAGDVLVVIKGYGPALETGRPPAVVDAAGDSLSTGMPKLTATTLVVLTDAPATLGDPASDQAAHGMAPIKHLGGTLLTLFDGLEAQRATATSGRLQDNGLPGFGPGDSAPRILAASFVPDFHFTAQVQFTEATGTGSAPPPPPGPFDAVDDRTGVSVGAASGNVIGGLGGGADLQSGGSVASASGTGAPVVVTGGGVDIAGQYGTLHIAADGSVSYQRTAGGVTDFAGLPNDAKDVFTYVLLNGDGRSDSATLSFDLMPATTASGDATGSASDEALLMGAGSQGMLSGLGGEDRLVGNAGDDKLSGGADNDYLQPGAGTDEADGGAGDDTLDLGANLDASDKIDGGAGQDVLRLDGDYSAGVTFNATTVANVEAIDLADGHDYKLTLDDATNAGGLTVDAGSLTGTDTITLDGSAETGAPLTAIGGAGDDALAGGGGDDVLTGNGGADTLTAGAGTDTLSGDDGDDTLLLGAGLDNADRIDGGAGTDTAKLDGDYSGGLTLGAATLVNVEVIELATGHHYDLKLDDATNATGLTVDGSALGAGDSLDLDGSAETSAALTAKGGAGDDTLTSGAGDDVLDGGAGNDTIDGGTGTDQMTGGAGNDVFNLGADLTATDKIDGGADGDTVTLDGDYSAGFSFGAATVANVETITVAAGNDYKLILDDATNGAGLEIDGSGLGAGDVLAVDGSAETSAALTATGGSGDDSLTGAAGDDELTGNAGDDTLTSGSGSDTLSGGAGDDVLDVGANLDATDEIDGGADSDTLKLDGDYSLGVAFNATTVTNVEAFALADGHDYKLTLDDASNSTGLTIDGSALSAPHALTLDGSAETSASLTALGGGGDDALKGGAGNDALTGNDGADTLTAGSGNDTLDGGAGADTLNLAGNLTAADRIDGGADQDTLLLAGNYAAGVAFTATTLTNVETIALADGNSYKLALDDATNAAGLTVDGGALSGSRALSLDGSAETSAALTATGGAGDDALTGGAGDDQLDGGAGNDTLTAGAGADQLTGGAGNDTFDLGADLTAVDKIDGGADADTLALDGDYGAGFAFTSTNVVGIETITVAAGHDYVLALDDATNAAGLKVEGASLGAGDRLTVDGSAETSAALTATGGAGDDSLTGGAGNDVLTGNAGKDTLTAGSGNDTLAGGIGDDILDLGANLTAADKIDGGADTDTLRIGGDYSAGVAFGAATVTNVEIIALADGNDYKLTLADASNTTGLTIDGSGLTAPHALTLDGSAETGASLTALGGGGDDVLKGGAGNDTLTGNDGADMLTAGAGNDTLSGGAGADTFVLAGNLTAADKIDGGADADTLQLNGNYSAGVTFNATTVANVETIQLAAGNSYKLTLEDATNGAGLTVNASALAAANALTLDGSAETTASLTATGGAGNDTVSGGGGGDKLDGGAGNDTLNGNAGDDTLTAGAGNDTINGGAGNDTFVLGANFAATDKIDGGADIDTLQLNGNYSAGVTLTATSLVNVEAVTVADGNSYKLTLVDANNTAGLTVDGSALTGANLLNVNGAAETTAALVATGGSGADVLAGGGGKDALTGNAGNDTLTGNNGDDTLVAGAGTDTLVGGNGNDTLDLGADLDAADKIDGGANTDTLKLDGDYGAGVVFGTATLVSVEAIALAAGHDYKFTLNNATNAAALSVDGSALGAGNTLILDGSAETASPLTATGGAGDDKLTGGAGSDKLDGGAGNDAVTTGAGNDTVTGGAGNDVINLAANLTAADQIDGGADTDIVTLQGNYSGGVVLGATTVSNVEEIDLVAGFSYKLTLNDATNAAGLKIDGTALAAGQVLTIDGSAETSAVLSVTGGVGNDVLTGGAGADSLSGGTGNDTLTAGAGIDTISGGVGNDTIAMAGNLTAADQIDGGMDTDTVTLNGNYSAGVTFSATTVVNVEAISVTAGNSYKLILDDATNATGLTVSGAALAAPNFLFIDGSAETSAALTATGGAGDDTLSGGAGSDVLTGGNGNDTLSAGAGTDTLSGGNGNDIVDLAGNLTAADKIDGGANTDTLKLDGDYGAGLTLAATTVVNVESFVLAANHDYKLTLDNATNSAGLTVDASALGAANVLTLDGSAETASALTATGGAGNDTITGGAGADKLDGGAGDDVLVGNNSNNTLTAGSGDDTLTAGTGADTFILGADLTVADKIDGGTGTDTLTLAGDYSAGLVLAATTLVNVEVITAADGSSYNLTLNDANNGAGLTVNAALSAGFSLTLDGSAETAAALTATAGAGNDVLIGGAGADRFTSGAGQDVLTGNGGNDIITLAANLDAADKIDGGTGTDTVNLAGNYSAGVTFNATTVVNVETIVVAAGGSYKLVLDDATNTAGLTVTGSMLGAGDVLDLDGSAESASALAATGGAGADVLRGGAGNDILTPGAGNDTIDGGAGNDTIAMAANLNAADTIDGGSGTDTVTLSGDYSAGVNFTATTVVNVETVTLSAGNSYKLVLGDATNGTGLAVYGAALGAANFLDLNSAAETSATLTATGGAGNDIITGGAGNDVLTTGAGTDTISGGAGNDTIVLAGNLTAADKIDGGADKDTVQLSGAGYAAGLVLGATTLVNVEAVTVAAGNNYSLTLDDANNSAGLIVNASALAAANFLILDDSAETSAALTATGGAGNDVITGGAGADVLTAGAGIDTLNGGVGADSFILAGNLAATDKIDGGADADTLSLNGNYSAGITFTATTVTNVETITLTDGNSYKLTLHDATNAAGLTIDGSLLGATRTVTVDGSAETTAGLTVNGGAGNDTETGGAGADHLNGGAGNDTLAGNGGADVLYGGAGNDTETGGLGADIFAFNLADLGKDKVSDFKLAEGDVLEFSNVLDGPGSDLQDLVDAGVTAVGSAGNCVISWNGGNSTVTLTGVGGSVASVADLATLLGTQLHVSH